MWSSNLDLEEEPLHLTNMRRVFVALAEVVDSNTTKTILIELTLWKFKRQYRNDVFQSLVKPTRRAETEARIYKVAVVTVVVTSVSPAPRSR